MTTPEARFQARAAELKTYIKPYTMPDGTPIQFFNVECDGCGLQVPIEYEDPQLPSGWVAQENGEYCPNCTELRPPLLLPSPVHLIIQYDAEEGQPFTANCSCALGFDHDVNGAPVPHG